MMKNEALETLNRALVVLASTQLNSDPALKSRLLAESLSSYVCELATLVLASTGVSATVRTAAPGWGTMRSRVEVA